MCKIKGAERKKKMQQQKKGDQLIRSERKNGVRKWYDLRKPKGTVCRLK